MRERSTYRMENRNPDSIRGLQGGYHVYAKEKKLLIVKPRVKCASVYEKMEQALNISWNNK